MMGWVMRGAEQTVKCKRWGDMNNIDSRKELKRHLAAGLIWPAEHGTLVSTVDLEEYERSKKDRGFIHQMPIQIHLHGGGAGKYDEWITRYLTQDEAHLLCQELQTYIAALNSVDKKIHYCDIRYC